MHWLADISVRRPVFAWVMILVICVLGAAGYMKIGVDRFPKIDFPVVSVVTVLPGASPREVESEVSEPIEATVNTIAGLDEMNSISSEGVSQVVLRFVLEKDVDDAVQEVRDAVSSIQQSLPEGTQQPIVRKFDPDAIPVLLIGVNGNAPVRDITEYVDKKIRPALENAQGVGGVTIIGGRARQVNIWLDPDRLAAQGLVAADVQRTIARENLSLPGGALDSGVQRVTVRLEGRVSSVEQLADVVIRQIDGHSVRIRDVATVEDGMEEEVTMAARDGKPAVILSIRKQSGTNTVAVVDAIQERMEDIRKTLPPTYSLDVVKDNSATTRTSLHAVNEHLLLGGIFAILVVLLFLGDLRSTFIAGIAIPISVVGTFALLWMFGFTLNTISLLGLALSVGIVIDDAIVVLENIHRYIHEEKIQPFPAAILATREIGLAVLATTLSLIAVFLPVAFMGGIPGRFLASFGWTMSFAVVVSMFVSFTITPMLSSRMLKAPPEHGKKPLFERMADAVMSPLNRAYAAILGFFVRWRIVAVVLTGLTFFAIIPLGMLAPKGFLPKSDEAQIEMTIRLPESAGIAQTRIVSQRIADEVRETIPEVELVLLTIGDNNQRKVNEAAINVRLIDPRERDASQDEVMNRIRENIASKAPKDVTVKVSNAPLFSGGSSSQNAAVQYGVSGPDLDQVIEYSRKAQEILKTIPGAVDVDSSVVLGKPEVVAKIDRDRAADLGVQVGDVASTLQIALGGVDVGSYAEFGEQYDIHLKADPNTRVTENDLSSWYVPSSALGRAPLLDVVTLSRAEGPSSIDRYQRQRQVMVTANTAPGTSAGQVVEAFDAKVDELHLKPGYKVAPIGQSREIAKTGRSFMLAFGLSLIFMYLVLAAQFESWVHPFTIMVSLPLTVPFALISVIVLGQQLDLYSMLGILVLFGVVKKNSILQVDRIIQLRAQGLSRTEAVISGSRDRLRPILMTTVAFVAGMIPLVTSDGVGAAFNQATAGVVVGGQTLSRLLTLLVTPVAYTLLDDVSRAFWWVVGKILGTATPEQSGSNNIEPHQLEAQAARVNAGHVHGGV